MLAVLRIIKYTLVNGNPKQVTKRLIQKAAGFPYGPT
jgi:hypothetical protein